MLLLVLLAFQLPLQAQPAPREANVRLGWSPGWTETGITLAPGETLTIRVRTIKAAPNDRQQETAINPATGAGGYARQDREPERKSLADTLLKAAARQVIVGRIGEGSPFVVGRRYRQVARAGGGLSLRWNVPREMAAAESGFDVSITVDPAPVVEKKSDPPIPPDPIDEDPPRNTISPIEPVPVDDPPVENKSVVEPPADEGNVSQPEGNSVSRADPEDSPPPAREPREVGDPKAVAAKDRESGLSAAQLALVGGGAAALLLLLIASGVAVQRWRRRKLVNRTRSLLALSPSLDLGEGACRGGSLPADGPAASLRARLEEGAIRSVEGGDDG
jgi:hypothetical protein